MSKVFKQIVQKYIHKKEGLAAYPALPSHGTIKIRPLSFRSLRKNLKSCLGRQNENF